MSQPKIWSLDGVTPEARERAQEAAASEGITVAEWLQRKLLNTANNGAPVQARNGANSRRIDEAVNSMSRLFETNQRAQTDMNRAIETIAGEINAAAQDQAGVLQELSGRVEKLERSTDTADLKDNIRTLGTNVSRIADHAAREIAAAAGQIGGFANTLESMDEKVGFAKAESQRIGLFVQEQLTYAAERIRAAEAGLAKAGEIARQVADLEKQTPRVAELEDAVAGLEHFGVTAAEELAGLTGSVSQLKEQSSQLREESQGLSARIQKTEDRTSGFGKLETAVASLKDRLGDLKGVEDSIAGLTAREDAARTRTDSMGHKLDGLTTNFAAACDASVRTQRDMRSQVQVINQRLEAAAKEMAVLARADSVEKLTTRLGELDGIIQATGIRIGAQEGQSEHLAGRVRSAETVLSTLPEIENSLARLNRQLMEADARSAQTASGVETARESTVRLAERMRAAETLMASYPELQDTVGQLRAHTHELDSRDLTVAAEIAVLNETLGAAIAKIDAARSDAEGTAGRVMAAEAVLATVPNMEARIAHLSHRSQAYDQVEKSVAALGRREAEMSSRVGAIADECRSHMEKFLADQQLLATRLQEMEARIAMTEAYEQRLDSLDTRVSSLGTIPGDVAALAEGASAMSGRFDTATSELREYCTKLSSENSRLTERLQNAELLLENQAHLEERFEAFARRASVLDRIDDYFEKLARIDSERLARIDELTRRLQSLDGQTQSARGELEAISQRVLAAEERTESLKNHETVLGTLTAEVTALSGLLSETASEVNGRLSEFEERAAQGESTLVESVSGQIAELKAGFDARESENAQRFGVLSAEVTALSGLLSETANEVTGRLSEIQERVAQEAVQGENTLGDDISGQIAQLKAGFDAQEAENAQRLGALSAEVSALSGLLSETANEVTGRLSEIEERAAQEETQGESTLADDISGQIAELKAENAQRFGVLASDLDALSTEISGLREQSAVVISPAEFSETQPVPEDRLEAPEAAQPSEAEEISLRPLPDLPPEPMGLQSIDDLPPQEADAENEGETKLEEVRLEPVNLVPGDLSGESDEDYLERARHAALSAAEKTRHDGHSNANANANAKAWVADVSSRKPPVLLGTMAGLLLAAAAGVYYMIPRDEPVAGISVASTQAGSMTQTVQPPSGSALEGQLARANLGDGAAMLALGMAYANGTGVERDDATAVTWFTRAAETGAPMAQFQLGVAYEKGIGVAADPVQAARWYGEAANRGNVKSMYNLGVAYANGSGVGKDLVQAAHWFEEAASYGLQDALFNLAVLYEHGLGVKPSLGDAYKWYAVAAAAGDPDARMRVEAIAMELPRDQKAAAEKFAASFQPKSPDPVSNELTAAQSASR